MVHWCCYEGGFVSRGYGEAGTLLDALKCSGIELTLTHRLAFPRRVDSSFINDNYSPLPKPQPLICVPLSTSRPSTGIRRIV